MTSSSKTVLLTKNMVHDYLDTVDLRLSARIVLVEEVAAESLLSSSSFTCFCQWMGMEMGVWVATGVLSGSTWSLRGGRPVIIVNHANYNVDKLDISCPWGVEAVWGVLSPKSLRSVVSGVYDTPIRRKKCNYN